MGNPLNSWTASFFREWWPYMSVPSLLRCRKYALRMSKEGHADAATVRLSVQRPLQGDVLLREVVGDWWTFQEIVRTGVYKNILSYISDCETVIDVGANIGLAALYFASQYKTSRILAVEPSPDNFALLDTNLADLVRRNRCKTIKAAVWERRTSLAANPLPGPGRFNGFSLREFGKDDAESVRILGLPMSAIVEESGFDRIDILKIDIEGAEVQMFRSELGWLERVRSILIEFHGNSRAESNFDSIVKDYGFRIREEDWHTVVAVKD